MLTISTADDVLLTSVGGRSTFLRVDVKDSGGTDRDLTTYPGENMVMAANWGEGVDSPAMSGTVLLKREVEQLSLAPLMDASPLNRAFNPAASPVPLIYPHREIKIYTAVMPDGVAPASGDWKLKLHGRIDAIDWGRKDSIELKVSDKLQGDLRDTFIETERVYAHADPADSDAVAGCRIFGLAQTFAFGELMIPSEAKRNQRFFKCTTPGTTSATVEPAWTSTLGATTVSGTATFTCVGLTTTTVGTAVETVLGQIPGDNGTATTITTPVSPGWLIKWYLQQRVNCWDAVRQLVDQIGYDMRPRYDSGSSSFKMTFSAIDRAKTSPDRTFSKSEKLQVSSLKIDVADIRNVVRVVYSNSGNLDAQKNPIRAYVEVSDAGSVTLFGRRYMEIQESSSSNIDSQSEATTMANAALADLCLPKAECETLLEYFPFVELGDLYRFSSDELHHDSNLDLAVIGYQHSVTADGEAVTTLSCRGKPSGGSERWLARAAEINTQDTHQLSLGNRDGLSISTSDVVGGTKLKIDPATMLGKHAIVAGFEVHLSDTPSFTPGVSTFKGQVIGNEFVAGELIAGQTYYAQVIPFGNNATKPVKGLPSAEFSFIAARAQAGHITESIALGSYPLNGGFETRQNAAAMPDHWTVASGTFGTGIVVMEDGNGVSGSRYMRMTSAASLRQISSCICPLINDYNTIGAAALGGSQRYLLTALVKTAVGNTGSSNLFITATGVTYQGVTIGAMGGSGVMFVAATSKPGVWQRITSIVHCDGFNTMRGARVHAFTDTGGAGAVYDIDEVRLTLLGSPWFQVGDTSFFTDRGDAIPGFVNNFTHYDTSTELEVAFRHDESNRAELQGRMKKTSGALPADAFTLPPGFRPRRTKRWIVESAGGAGYIEISSAGVVRVIGGNSTDIRLDGISFETF